MDTIWLAEAYPWWRKHQMEARSSTVVSALMARETTRLTIGWGIISPWTRHPGAGRDGRAGRAGGGRAGSVPPRVRDVEDLPQQHQGPDEEDAWADARRGRDRARRPRGEASRTTATRGAPTSRRSPRGAHAARRAARLRRRDGAEDAGARGRDRGRVPDAVDHDAGIRPLHVRERRRRHRHRLHGRRVDPRDDRDAGRDGAREIAGMYLANKVQNIAGAADTLLDLAGIEMDEIRPVAEAMEQGGRLAAKAKVTDALLDKCRPIAGTPADCIAAIEEYRDAGLHARDARALGRGPARADPPLRREGAAALPRLMATVTVRGTGSCAAQPDDVHRRSGRGGSSHERDPRRSPRRPVSLRTSSSLCDELGVPAGSRTTSRVSLAEHGEHTDAGWQHRGYRATARVAARLAATPSSRVGSSRRPRRACRRGSTGRRGASPTTTRPMPRRAGAPPLTPGRGRRSTPPRSEGGVGAIRLDRRARAQARRDRQPRDVRGPTGDLAACRSRRVSTR